MKTSICKNNISDSHPMTSQPEATSNYDITFNVFRTDVRAFGTKSRLSADIVNFHLNTLQIPWDLGDILPQRQPEEFHQLWAPSFLPSTMQQ